MHQPMRYWPGPPPFSTYGGATGSWGNGAGFGGGIGPFSNTALAVQNNEQVTTFAEGLICILGTDGRLIPFLPQTGATPLSSAPDASPLAKGLICVLSNGKIVAPNQQAATGPFSTGPVSPSIAACVIWSTDGKIIPMNLCGGG